MKRRGLDYAAAILHFLILRRIRLEALCGRLRPGAPKRRVLATACWRFPIYSQTFVYREIAELTRRGFNLRFAYSELAPRTELAGDCSIIWRRRRQLVLTDRTSDSDMEYYQRRMPQRVSELIAMLAASSGLGAAEIAANRHFRHAFSFTRMAECWRADYIHSYFFYERAVFALVASYLLGVPRGVSCYADHLLNDYVLKVVPLHLASSDVIVATSQRIRQELIDLARGPLPQAIVKPNAINTRHFTAERSRPNASRPFRIAAVNRIHPKKGLRYLVEAAAELHGRGMSCAIDIAGEPDVHDPESLACFEELSLSIANLELASCVRLRGKMTNGEVRRFLAEADIFVAPFIELPGGDKDGIPTALLEAMASGCAVVATHAGSIGEVVDHEHDGLIVPQRDPVALAGAIARLMQDDSLRARLARAAVEKVRSQFDVSSCEIVFHERVRAAIAAKAPRHTMAAPCA